MKYTILLFALLLSISSCSNDTEAWKEDRDQLVGRWIGESSYTRTYEDGEIETGTSEVSVDFISTSKVVFDNNSFAVVNDWYYQPDPETVLIENTVGLTISGTPSVIEILENSKNRQKWATTIINYEYIPDSSYYRRYESEEVWTMERQ